MTIGSREYLLRASLGLFLTCTKQATRNRRTLYAGAHGLRMIALHETRGSKQLDALARLADYCQEHFTLAGPEDVDAITAGTLPALKRDKLLMTFDDGHADNFEGAKLLAERKIRAVFFVIPSFLDRSVDEYYAFHEANGVRAHRFAAHHRHSRGLARSQVKEMQAMGHRIAAHNYAHRDLGQLHAAGELQYEIARALDELSELLEEDCLDFAFGFGHARHVSAEAAAFLQQRCRRVYACVRGLNVSGRTPRFLLRDGISPEHPTGFTRAAIKGALDHRYVAQWTELERMSERLPVSRCAREL